jgi:hypothetical protein
MAVDKNTHTAKSHNNMWWTTDSKGRRIGHMYPEDMLMIIDSIWGYRKGTGGFVRYSGMSVPQVGRYIRGEAPIPKHIALLLLLMQREAFSREDRAPSTSPFKWLPTTDATWLPDYAERLHHPNRHPTFMHADDME